MPTSMCSFINSHQDLLMRILYAFSFRFYEYENIFNTMFLYRNRDLITSEKQYTVSTTVSKKIEMSNVDNTYT